MAVERGRMLIQARRFEQAKQQLAPLVAANPDNSLVWRLMALAHHGSEEYAQAQEAVTTALTLAPQQADLHVLLGRVLISRERIREGVDCAERALRIAPDLVDAHLLIAAGLAQVQRDLGRALWHAERARDLEPDSPRTHYIVGSTLFAYRTRKAAVRARMSLETALSIDPQYSDAWNFLGLTDLLRRRSASAMRSFIRALQSNPHSEAAADNLPLAVWVLVSRGWIWMFGVLLLNMVFTVFAELIGAQSPVAGVAAHLVGAALIAGASWWVVLRRLLAVFPESMRLAARRVLRRDPLVRPSWLGLVWAGIMQVVTLAVPWDLGHPTMIGISLCVWLSAPGYLVGRLLSRFWLARRRRSLQSKRRQQWQSVVVG